MVKNNPENSKKITITVDDHITTIPSYELFLIRGEDDYMEIQLAKKTETDEEIKIHIDSVFRIPQKTVPQFARQFARYLQDHPYEQA